jgi:hypothetical protein
MKITVLKSLDIVKLRSFESQIIVMDSMGAVFSHNTCPFKGGSFRFCSLLFSFFPFLDFVSLQLASFSFCLTSNFYCFASMRNKQPKPAFVLLVRR